MTAKFKNKKNFDRKTADNAWVSLAHLLGLYIMR